MSKRFEQMYKWPISLWKDTQNIIRQEEQLKTSMRYHFIPLDRQNQELTKMRNNWHSRIFLVGMSEYDLLKKSFSYKYSPIIQLSNSKPKYLPKRNESVFPQRDSNANVYSSSICNSQKLNTPQVPSNR